MKKTLLLALLFVGNYGFSQPTEKKEEEKEKEATTQTITEALKKNTHVNISAFSAETALKKGIKIWKINDDKTVTNDSIEVDNISIFIDGGRIQRLVVDVKNDEGFYSNFIPISVTSFKNAKTDKIFYEGSNKKLENTYFILGDVLNYINYTSRISYPPTTVIQLTEEKVIDTLKFSSTPLEYFDVRAYTDQQGLSGNANGLAQTEINVSFYGNTRNVRHSNVIFFPYVRLQMSLSKFDSKFDTLKFTSLTERTNTDILSIYQYSKVAIRVETDIIRYSRIHDGYLSIGHQLLNTSISDTSKVLKQLFTPSFYLTLGGTMFSFPRMKCDFRIPLFFNYLNDQSFINYDRKVDLTIVPEIELTLDPIKNKGDNEEETDGTTVFARVKYFDAPDYRGSNFWQLQLGAKIQLTDVLKK